MTAIRLARWFALAACLHASAQQHNNSTQQPNSEAFRKDFLDKFQRTGLSTTPPDAMMLRILVESSGAKRGVEVGAASGFGAMNMGIAFERTGATSIAGDRSAPRSGDRQNLRRSA